MENASSWMFEDTSLSKSTLTEQHICVITNHSDLWWEPVFFGDVEGILGNDGVCFSCVVERSRRENMWPLNSCTGFVFSPVTTNWCDAVADLRNALSSRISFEMSTFNCALITDVFDTCSLFDSGVCGCSWWIRVVVALAAPVLLFSIVKVKVKTEVYVTHLRLYGKPCLEGLYECINRCMHWPCDSPKNSRYIQNCSCWWNT